MTKHFNIRVFGRVQGVSFRVYSKAKAQELNIKGFVQNEPEGSVFIEAEGAEKDLQSFLKWCKKGPQLAKVTKVESEEAQLKGYSEFSTR